jgi:hypothetical protein
LQPVEVIGTQRQQNHKWEPVRGKQIDDPKKWFALDTVGGGEQFLPLIDRHQNLGIARPMRSAKIGGEIRELALQVRAKKHVAVTLPLVGSA